MKLRIILANDRQETIDKQQQLVLDANPDSTIEGVSINPIKKNEAREGEFEVDFILKHKDEQLVENQIREGLEQAETIISQKDESLKVLAKEKTDLEKEKKELQKINKDLEKRIKGLENNTRDNG